MLLQRKKKPYNNIKKEIKNKFNSDNYHSENITQLNSLLYQANNTDRESAEKIIKNDLYIQKESFKEKLSAKRSLAHLSNSSDFKNELTAVTDYKDIIDKNSYNSVRLNSNKSKFRGVSQERRPSKRNLLLSPNTSDFTEYDTISNLSFTPKFKSNQVNIGEVLKNKINSFLSSFNDYFFDDFMQNIFNEIKNLLEEKYTKSKEIEKNYNNLIKEYQFLLNTGIIINDIQMKIYIQILLNL